MNTLIRVITTAAALNILTVGAAVASPDAEDTHGISEVALTDPTWATSATRITDPLWTTGADWQTDSGWMDQIDLEATSLVTLISEGQRLPRGAEVVYTDRSGLVIAELLAERGATLVTIVQSDDLFDEGMMELCGCRFFDADSVLVLNPDSMHPTEGRVGSNPTPHP